MLVLRRVCSPNLSSSCAVTLKINWTCQSIDSYIFLWQWKLHAFSYKAITCVYNDIWTWDLHHCVSYMIPYIDKSSKEALYSCLTVQKCVFWMSVNKSSLWTYTDIYRHIQTYTDIYRHIQIKCKHNYSNSLRTMTFSHLKVWLRNVPINTEVNLIDNHYYGLYGNFIHVILSGFCRLGCIYSVSLHAPEKCVI